MTIQAQFNANIAIGGCQPPRCADPSNPTNASTSMQGGQAVFENKNYRITADDNNTVTIHNKNTGETYQAWGDPHMNIDGKHEFDFWGTTTLQLDDGTKVTINTTPFKDDPSMTLSSKVTITNGDYGVQISGVDSNKTGDLKIDEAKGWGKVLDAVVSDGNTLHENPAGKGFVAVDDCGRVRKVDQQYINETDLQKGGKLVDQHKDAFQRLSSLVSILFQGGFCGNLPKPPEHDHGGGNGGSHGGGHRPRPGHQDGCRPDPFLITINPPNLDRNCPPFPSFRLPDNSWLQMDISFQLKLSRF